MSIKTKKFVHITPELQETLQVLGAKQKPRGYPGVKARIVPRPNSEIKVANEPPIINNTQQSVFAKPTEQVFATQMEGINEVSRTLSFHQRVGIFDIPFIYTKYLINGWLNLQILKRLFSSHQHKTDNNQTSEEKILSESESFAKPSESNDRSTLIHDKCIFLTFFTVT